MVALRKVSPSFIGTDQHWGGDDINNLVDIINGISTDKIASDAIVSILTGKDLTDPSNTFPSSLATLTTTQILTNKDLTDATNTFPSALATLTGSQILTNKTLTAPVVNGIVTTTGLTLPTHTLAEAANIILGTTTGTNIGTATNQKLGFYGKAPLTQQAAITAPTGGTTTDSQARTAIGTIITVLKNLGLTA